MNCRVCQRQTQPVRIDGRNCCPICGNPYEKPETPTTRTRALDMVAPRPPTLSAASLHHRPAPHIIDLRSQVEATASPASASALNHNAAAPPSDEARGRHLARFTDRFERAREFSRSAQISRFGTDRMHNINDPRKMYDKFGNKNLQTIVDEVHHTGAFAEPRTGITAPAPKREPAPPPQPGRADTPSSLPNHAITQHQAMTELPRLAPAPNPTPKLPLPARAAWRPNLNLSVHTNRFAATAAAVVLLGGYIWLHNYPKLAVQTAGSQAGLSAALPSYLPSSYSLTTTVTGPGQLTLKFTSPSAASPLTITQQRTSWDPNSLLDNYVAKNTDDYAAVEGQGLTIYLFGNNNADWVNRGIWYSIAGTDQLSRDQILKIAYSL